MFVSGCGPGKLKGAMFVWRPSTVGDGGISGAEPPFESSEVQEPRPFRAAEFTGEAGIVDCG